MHPTFSHIIIADDDPDDLDHCCEAIATICPKVEISTAADGVSLLQLLEDGIKPQLIVLDINMPSLNGIECLRLLQHKREYTDFHIVMLTTSGHINDIDTCKSLGATHYYVKPWSMKGYKAIVEDFMEGCVKPNPLRKFGPGINPIN